MTPEFTDNLCSYVPFVQKYLKSIPFRRLANHHEILFSMNTIKLIKVDFLDFVFVATSDSLKKVTQIDLNLMFLVEN